MEIYLLNSLSKKKEKFTPLQEGSVSLYSCGPTVYDYAHIGNFRSFLMSDLLFRMFTQAGLHVSKVQNITDVGHLTGDDIADSQGEDKISKKARTENLSPFDIAKMYEEAFIQDEEELRIIPPNQGRPRATEFIPQQIAMIKDLVTKDFAYQSNGSYYFRVSKSKDYGTLSGNKIENLDAGNRVSVNEEKESPLDFALWKKGDQAHLMQWDFQTGKRIPETQIPQSPEHSSWGFPGWHIECSAMSLELLGKSFDIHTGGEDNAFPHHECEKAQNEAAHGGTINYWLHGKHLLVDGKKMSKSLGNFYTIKDLLSKGWEGNEIRYALISSHYRSALNFSIKALEDARKSIQRIEEARRIFDKNSKTATLDKPYLQDLEQKFKTAIQDDLNVPESLAITFEAITNGHKSSPEIQKSVLEFLNTIFDQIFDIFPKSKDIDQDLAQWVESQIQERKNARDNKDWALADKIRDELKSQKITLLDESGGTSWVQDL